MVVIKHRGNFNNTERFLKGAAKVNFRAILDPYGQQGVRALASATPIDSGKTASSWGYEIVVNKGSVSLVWTNSNVVNGVPIAILLQYGHGTRNGGFVQGRDYINSTLLPIFDRISEEAWISTLTFLGRK
ncbi:hypothetical protein FACS189499_10690 [Clostridia bacterium]|nr:hypothetical protein FACS189499_10690 [Clostridia bacterium]